MGESLRQFSSSLQDPNQSVDPNAGQPNQSVDPNVGQPNQSVDPNAGQPNQSVDPNAGLPNQSVDPNAGQPNQSVDPNAGQPNQSVDPNAGQPSLSVDPNAGQPNQSVDPNAGQPNQCVDPNAGQTPASGSGADLSQEYNTALQAGDWPTAAEKLNGFNKEDILSRLKGLSTGQIASINQGARDNARVGPQSQVAQLTGTVSVTLQIAASGMITLIPGPGVPDGFDPNIIDKNLFKLPKIPEPFPSGPAGAARGAAQTASSTASTAARTAAAANTARVGATLLVKCTVVAAGLIIGFGGPFLVGYVVEHSEELGQRPDPDEVSLPGGAPPPTKEGDAGAPLPAVDPNSGQPLKAPANQNPAPATDPTTGQPIQAPGQQSDDDAEFGDKTGRKKSKDVLENQRARVEQLKKERDELESKRMKTPDDKEELEKKKRELKKAQDDLKASENHAQKSQKPARRN